jgi:hypothetical protein
MLTGEPTLARLDLLARGTVTPVVWAGCDFTLGRLGKVRGLPNYTGEEKFS